MDRKPPQNYPATKARQGEIVLRKRWQRAVFIGGLAACVLLTVVVWIWAILVR